MTAQPVQPLHAVPAPPPETELDALVRRRLEIDQKIDELGAEKTQIHHRLEHLVGVGNTHTTSFGTKVTVSPPSRRFDLRTATELLRHRDADALDRCRLEGFDAAKIKKQLKGEELDWSMLPGTGSNIVRIP